MKFKLAVNHRGLCETAYIDADLETYKKVGTELLAAEFGDTNEPEYFTFIEGKWLMLNEAKPTNIEFCAANFCDDQGPDEVEDDG